MPTLQHINEPALLFRYEQAVEDPRDGLTLFGPLEKGKPYGIRWGLIGPEECMQRVERWVSNVNAPVVGETADLARPAFPGFEAVFGIPLVTPNPVKTQVPIQIVRERLAQGRQEEATTVGGSGADHRHVLPDRAAAVGRKKSPAIGRQG